MICLGIFLIGIVSASYCCEKLVDKDAYCQSVDDVAQCATTVNPFSSTGATYRSIPASCEATSYCKKGTCIDQKQGTCMSNVPQIICDANKGSWNPGAAISLAQCKLGCCLMGSQASFTTKVSCNKLSKDYGVITTFQAGVTDQDTCLASASAGDEGACVYTKEFATTCERTTWEVCQEKKKSSELVNVTFHSGYLCSAADLGSNCAKTKNTKCDEKNNVRFVDTCGNLANIYSADKVEDEGYWTHIQNPTCGNNAGNKNSATCGSCDYFSGTMCGEKTTETVTYGNNVCKDLDCVDYRGEYYNVRNTESSERDDDTIGLEDFRYVNSSRIVSISTAEIKYATAEIYPRHGESWCATTGANDSVGSSYFKLLCYNGEVSLQECDPTRQEICAQTTSTYSDFSIGNCKVNLWQSCTAQNTSADCESTAARELRDCKWIDETENMDYIFNTTSAGTYLMTWKANDDDNSGVCVPKYSPGFSRDEDTRVFGEENCAVASTTCFVTKESGLFEHGWDCEKNCYCEEPTFETELNNICSSLGDCGVKKNYKEIFGDERSAITSVRLEED